MTEGFAPYPTPVTPRTSGRAITALALAIAAFVACPLFPAIAALFVAASAAREIRESDGSVAGDGLVTASRVVAVTNIVISLVVIPVLVAIAVPTFLGARERAQSDLLAVALAGQTFFLANSRFPSPSEFGARAITVPVVESPLPPESGFVSLTAEGPTAVYGARSDSGTCWYVRDSSGDRQFARDESCGSADVQNFVADGFPES